MKYFFSFLIIAMWFLATIILAISVVGRVVLYEDEWMEFPKKLLSIFENEKN